MKLEEYLRSDSPYSSTRLVMFLVVVTCLLLAVLAFIAVLVFSYLGKPISISEIAWLIAALLVPVITGKSVQSFAERTITTENNEKQNKQ